MSLKGTIKLVKKVLKDPDKNKLYSAEELTYMRMQMKLMQLQREKKKLARKQQKGFGYVKCETHQPHNGIFEDFFN